jgi:hypothetical protein
MYKKLVGYKRLQYPWRLRRWKLIAVFHVEPFEVLHSTSKTEGLLSGDRTTETKKQVERIPYKDINIHSNYVKFWRVKRQQTA